MQKLVVSDYDHTLNNRGISEYDISLISDFIKQGHLFVVASSRHYESLSNEMKVNQIPYNYLSCNNANSIYDNSGNLVFVNYLSDAEKYFIKHMGITPEVLNGKDAFGRHSPLDILYYQITLAKGKEFADEIIPLLIGQTLETDYFANSGYIFSGKMQKDFACEFIRNNHGINRDNVFTIGDGANDLSMIKLYNGYTLPWGVDEVKDSALAQVASVGNLLEMVQEDSPLIRRRIL